MSATLRVVREGFGIELRRGRFEVNVDGQSVGELEYRDAVETPVEPGHHTLRISTGRYSSLDKTFDVAEGDMANFRCHGASWWPRFVASLIKPDLAISLRRQ
jgi:hypothetical protein